MKRLIWIDYDVYPGHSTMLVIGWTPKEIIDWIHKKTSRRDDPLNEEELRGINSIRNQSGKSLMLKNGETILWLPGIPDTPYRMGILAHEAWHITDFILHRIGMEYIPDKSDEAFTYMLAHIVQTALIKLKVKITWQK